MTDPRLDPRLDPYRSFGVYAFGRYSPGPEIGRFATREEAEAFAESHRDDSRPLPLPHISVDFHGAPLDLIEEVFAISASRKYPGDWGR